MKRPNVVSAARYSRDVLDGKIPACSFVQAACRRHLDGLRHEKSRRYPYRFDPDLAQQYCNFIQELQHTKGKWARKKIKLEPFQSFVICNLFGWVRRRDGLRKYRKAYLELPRKNGKSLLAAAIGHALFAFDGEAGAEVFSGATTEKQAWMVFKPARLMAKKDPELREAFGISVHAKSLTIDESGAKFEPIIGNPGDGDSPHCAIHDEFHEHVTSEQADAMATGMGSRTQPLQLFITTAGVNLAGPCYDLRGHVINVIEGRTVDEELFGLIYTIDATDDWTDFSAWRKANPCIGVSVFEDFLRSRLAEAMTRTSRQNILRCKHLNQWLTANIAWMNLVSWRRCRRDIRIEDYAGKKCYVGMDLASRVDLAALAYIFPMPHGVDVFFRYYLPEATVMLPENDHYRTWKLDHHLTVTKGAAIDLDRIESDLLADSRNFKIVRLGYDPHQATQMVGHLDEEGIECVEIRQNTINMSDPMKSVEAAVRNESLHHDGDPITEWNAGNVVASRNAKDEIYPRKLRDADKIDGMVALIIGMNLANRPMDDESVYDSRGIEVL